MQHCNNDNEIFAIQQVINAVSFHRLSFFPCPPTCDLTEVKKALDITLHFSGKLKFSNKKKKKAIIAAAFLTPCSSVS